MISEHQISTQIANNNKMIAYGTVDQFHLNKAVIYMYKYISNKFSRNVV